MSARLIAERYAKALLELAEKEQRVDAILAELKSLQELTRAHADLANLVEQRLIAPSRKAQAFDRILEKTGASELLRRFFKVVAQAARLDLLHDIVDAYAHLVDLRQGLVEAEVSAATSLNADQQAKLAEALRRRTGRKVRLRVIQDPSLLGGLKVKVGSTVFDASLAGRLRLLQSELRSAS